MELLCWPVWGTGRDYSRATLGPAIGMCAAALGTRFMPWQQHVADIAGELDSVTGHLVYREVVLLVPRQQGKTTEVLAQAIHRCIGWGQRMRVVYTAQTRIKAREKWETEHVYQLMQSDIYRPMLDPHDNYRRTGDMKAVDRVKTGMGSEAIIWPNDSIWGIESVQKDSGHGPTIDTGFIDEAFAQIDNRIEQGMRPAMLTRSDAQLWVLSTAGTRVESPYLLGKVERGRDRIESGATSRTAYFEWTAATRSDPTGRDVDMADPAVWTRCMPALGYTIDEQTVAADQDGMDADEFARAYGNLWRDAMVSTSPIKPLWWADCRDESSTIDGRPMWAVDMDPDRAMAWIGAAGTSTADPDKVHVELVERQPGEAWVPAALEELHQRHGGGKRQVVIDTSGPAVTLIRPLEKAGWTVHALTVPQVCMACAGLHDGVRDGMVAHPGEPEVATAVFGAGKSKLGDRWRLNRGASSTNIAPLMAVVLAHYGNATHPARKGSILDTVG